MLAGMSIFVAMKTERIDLRLVFRDGKEMASGWSESGIIIDVTAWMSPDECSGILFFGRSCGTVRLSSCKSSPKGCGLYSAIPNAWLKKSSCRCSSSYSLMRSCNASLNCRFFSPSLARMFARWLVMFPLLRCNNSHIWLTVVLSCSIKRQMFNSDGDKLGYILWLYQVYFFFLVSGKGCKKIFFGLFPYYA